MGHYRDAKHLSPEEFPQGCRSVGTPGAWYDRTRAATWEPLESASASGLDRRIRFGRAVAPASSGKGDASAPPLDADGQALAARLEDHVRALCRNTSGRSFRQMEALGEARDYIAEQFRAQGHQVAFQEYEARRSRDRVSPASLPQEPPIQAVGRVLSSEERLEVRGDYGVPADAVPKRIDEGLNRGHILRPGRSSRLEPRIGHLRDGGDEEFVALLRAEAFHRLVPDHL